MSRHAKAKERISFPKRLFRAATVGVAGYAALSVLAPSEIAVDALPKVTAEAPAPSPTSKPSPKISESPTPDNAGLPQIALDTPELPQNIGLIANATVELVNPEPGTEFASSGSGTILNIGETNIIMTAGHVTEINNEQCAQSIVSFPSTTQLGPGTEYFGQVTPSERIVVNVDGTDNYNAFTYNNSLDAAVVVPKTQMLFNGRPSLAVQDKVSVEPGDRVFALGYGPRTETYDPDPLSSDAVEQDPQIIPGTVLEQEDDKVVFITGIKGYGMRPDDTVRPGDSGGTFVDAEGNYLGDTIATSAEESTGSALESRYNVDLPEAAENQTFTWAVAQVIDKPILKSLMNRTVECTS